jgi:alpha-methylacyl-CoA racemase
VTRIDRPSSTASDDVLCRGKRSIAVNPKMDSGLRIIRRLIADADVVIDPFRPGVLERLGLGPEIFLGRKGLNDQLVYARIAG